MATYAILTKTPDKRVEARLEAAYPGKHYAWSPTISFVETGDTAVAISDKIGVAMGTNRKRKLEESGQAVPETHPDPLTHVAIMRLGASYWGHSEAGLWEWLKASFESAG